MSLELLTRQFADYHTEAKQTHEKTAEAVGGLGDRLRHVEQQLARRGKEDFGPAEVKGIGHQVTDSDAYKAFVAGNLRGTMNVSVKAITTAADSAGALIAPDRQTEVITGPRLRLRVRDVLAPGTTTSNTIEAMREKVFTNAAAPVAETALKPESSITYEPAIVPVRTLAHWLPISRQAMEDAPLLRSVVTNAMVYGLNAVEDQQLLMGDGTGQNLTGLVTAATDYDTGLNAAGDNPADTVLKAITQCETGSQLPVTAIILNSTDWAEMIGLKGADGHYLSGGPFSATRPMLWGRPVVESPNMPLGSFLVLNGTQAAQIFDRMETEVLISSEDRDNFISNNLTLRAEKRIALLIRRVQAVLFGTFPA
jgi:HK97 family phage major capsid protein